MKGLRPFKLPFYLSSLSYLPYFKSSGIDSYFNTTLLTMVDEKITASNRLVNFEI